MERQAKAFVKAFQDRYKRPPTGVDMEAYDTLGVVAAIEKADSTDHAAIIKALEGLKYEGVNAIYSFSREKRPPWAYHQFMDVAFTIIQYTAANQTPDDAAIVYPKEWATTDKILP